MDPRTGPGRRAKLEVRGETGADQRTYKADFSKFATTFPDFKFEWTPRDGATQLAAALTKVGFGAKDLVDPRFVRMKWLRHLIAECWLDDDLRWSAVQQAAAGS